MAITAQCGSCNKKFKANDKLAGKRVKCPRCGGAITIPALGPSEARGSTEKSRDSTVSSRSPHAS